MHISSLMLQQGGYISASVSTGFRWYSSKYTWTPTSPQSSAIL